MVLVLCNYRSNSTQTKAECNWRLLCKLHIGLPFFVTRHTKLRQRQGSIGQPVLATSPMLFKVSIGLSSYPAHYALWMIRACLGCVYLHKVRHNTILNHHYAATSASTGPKVPSIRLLRLFFGNLTFTLAPTDSINYSQVTV